MRWLKHLSIAHDDPAICELLEEFGPEGYGIYWLLLEHVALSIEKDSDETPSRTHSVVEWARICCCSARRLRSFVQRSAELSLIVAHSVADLKQFSSRLPADRLQIDVPKLLKYRDEYTKRSGQTTRQMEIEKEKEREIEEQAAKPAAPAPPAPIELPAKIIVEALKAVKEKTVPANGTRFALTDLPSEWLSWAILELGWDEFRAQRVFLVFADYWRAKPGAGGRKMDWIGTWRNWCRKDDESPPRNLFSVGAPKESATDRAIRVGLENVAKTGRL